MNKPSATQLEKRIIWISLAFAVLYFSLLPTSCPAKVPV